MKDFNANHLTAVVTGGTTRIGLAVSERLRAGGWRVLTSSHRADAGADIVADLAETTGAARLYAEALRLLGGQPPDLVVNNAGLFAQDPVDAATAARIEAVNYTAAEKLTILAAGRESGRGAVVNILDSRALAGEGGGAYLESKRKLVEFTHRAAALFADTLRVNGVAPGPVLAPVGFREKAGFTPLGRPTPEAVAESVAFLAEAEHTTGCIIPVDGGEMALSAPMRF